MNSGKGKILYGLGEAGYEVLEESEGLDPRARSTFVLFCKTLQWKPVKLDQPESKCAVALPCGKEVWLCVLEEGDKDPYDRKLTLRVQATLYDKDSQEFAQALQQLSQEESKSLPMGNLHLQNEAIFLFGDDLVNSTDLPAPSRNKEENEKMPPKAEATKPVSNPISPKREKQTTYRPRCKSSFIWFMSFVSAAVVYFLAWKFQVAPQRNEIIELGEELRAIRQSLGETFLDGENQVDPHSIKARYEENKKEEDRRKDSEKEFEKRIEENERKIETLESELSIRAAELRRTKGKLLPEEKEFLENLKDLDKGILLRKDLERLTDELKDILRKIDELKSKLPGKNTNLDQ